MATQAKSRKFPNAIIVVTIIMILAMVMTWFIPAGQYDTLEGSTTLDANSYHFVASTPVSVWDLLQAVFGGMSKSANVICFTLLVGALFNVLIETRSVDGFLNYLTGKLGANIDAVIPIVVFVMSVLGATGVMANPVVAVIPIGLVMARQLKLDRISAMAIMFLAAYSGYATSPMCALTVQIAQKIAEIPVMSGFGFRCVIWVVFFVPTLAYIVSYTKKIRRDPAKSIMAGEGAAFDDENAPAVSFTAGHAIALIGLVATLGIYTYGSLNLKWSMGEMATMMLIMALIAAAANRMSPNSFAESMIRGGQKMAFSALLIGLASGVSVILTNGNILHSIIHGMAVAMNYMPHALAAPVMFLFNLLFNFFVNSGSAQATVVMPIMAPLADVVGLTRQAAVNAFQLGDGLSNVIFPTSGTMMACLAIAGVDFKKWIRFVMPLFLAWTAMGIVTMMIIVAMGIV